MARTLKIKIDGDNSGLKEALDDSEGKLGGFSSKVASFAGSIAKGGLLIGGAGIAIATKIGVDAVGAASDMNETLSKTDAVFGESSTAIKAWADNAAKSMGQSKQQALDAADTFALMGKSAGLTGTDVNKFAQDFTGLAADLGSFYNSSPEEAIQAIGSALRGEAEPIRKFGVMMDDATLKAQAMKMGLIKTTTEALTPQNKMLAASQLIMAQTTVAQGDFAKTSDGLANKTKIMSAQFADAKVKIGDLLLPAMLKITNMGMALIPVFERFGTAIAKKVGPVIQEVTGALWAFVGGFKNVADGVTSSGFAGTLEGIGIKARLVFDWMKVNVPPVIAEIGRVIRDDVIPAVQAFAGWVRDDLWPVVQTVFGWLKENVPPAIAEISRVINEDVIPAIQGFAEWMQTRLLPAAKEIWDHLTEKLQPIFERIADIVENKVGPAFSTIVAVIRDNVIPILKDMWDKFDTYVFPALKFGAKLAVDMWTGMVDMALKVGGAVLSVIAFAGQMKQGITEKFDAAVTFVKEFPGKIKNAIGDLGSALFSKGEDIVQGLIDGIMSKIGPLIRAAEAIANAIPGPVAAILRTGSPSKVMMGLGADTMEGFRLGLANNPVDVGQYLTVPTGGYTAVGGSSRFRPAGGATTAAQAPARATVGGTVRLIVDGRQLAESALPAIRQLAWAAR